MVLLVQRYSRTARGTQRFDSWKIRAPVFGKLTLKLAMSFHSDTGDSRCAVAFLCLTPWISPAPW